MVRKLIVTGVAVATLMGAALPAAAQQPLPIGGRSYRGLFGSGLQGLNQALTFDGTLGGGLDTNVLTAEPPVAGEPATTTGSTGGFGRASMALNYWLNLDRVNLQARGGGIVSQYRAQQHLVRTYRADVRASAPLWDGANLSANYALTFRPFYYLPWVASVVGAEQVAGPVPEIDETAGAIGEYHTNTNASTQFNQRLSRRFSLAMSYSYQQSDSGSGTRDLLGWSAMAAVNYSIGKGLGVRMGYGLSESHYAGSQSYRTRNINGGLNFNRALSLTRSTTLAFSTGTTAVVDEFRTYYRADIHATLTRELGRSWAAQLLYNRSVSFDDAFRVPVPSDAFALSVRGLVNRQLAFHSELGTIVGRLGFGSSANRFDTYYGRAGILYGLSRMLGCGLNYTYFRFGFDSETAFLPGMVRRSDRSQVHGFVTIRTALFKGQRGS